MSEEIEKKLSALADAWDMGDITFDEYKERVTDILRWETTLLDMWSSWEDEDGSYQWELDHLSPGEIITEARYQASLKYSSAQSV